MVGRGSDNYKAIDVVVIMMIICCLALLGCFSFAPIGCSKWLLGQWAGSVDDYDYAVAWMIMILGFLFRIHVARMLQIHGVVFDILWAHSSCTDWRSRGYIILSIDL